MKPGIVLFGVALLFVGGAFVYQITQTAPEEEVASQPNSVSELSEPTGTPTDVDQQESAPVYTEAQVAENDSQESCWTIIDGTVYDITEYVPRHPGGISEILSICGEDGSAAFASVPNHAGGARSILASFEIGTLAQ